ncbi:hypothetical protein GCG54_00013095 [Colletotrichum gloeosporioides]|uniref:Uncharacterized protein n=1 Tax=Colletotrichum gloeosporioides TaxID=474922 RepID=A0A8H8WN04_COLGL|nr:uncharacterized protein GCG54_00013095 [Colletotrichum gloeosporioides]KAF3796920.1 hypothetical protein GCG54_00013095 [Colletotrichum gloeosporioides]
MNPFKSSNNQAQAAGQSKEDPVDKARTDGAYLAFDFATKKAGHDMPRSTDEKITDAGRNMYEKLLVSSKKVNPKISN